MKNNSYKNQLKFTMQQAGKCILFLICFVIVNDVKAQFTNVPVTGFNADVVGDGAVGIGTNSTTADVDGAGWMFVSTTFNPGSGICASGATALPASNTITSTNATTATGITYTLQSYGAGTITNNNALRLDGTTTSGTLTSVTPFSASKLYFVCLGGSGATVFNAIVNFTDATSFTISGLSADDWCSATATNRLTSQQYYRIQRTATTCTGGTCQYLFEIAGTISGANYGKTISSITINRISGGVLNIMALGMQSPCTTPNASPSFSTPLSANGSISQITGVINPASPVPTGGYLVVRYPAGSVQTPPVTGTAYIAGNSLGLGTVVQASASTSINATGLNGGTSYDFYIYSYNTAANCGGPVYSSALSQTGIATASCGSMSGIIPIGPSAPASPVGFPSLTAALSYIALNGIGASTILELQTDYLPGVETYPIIFPANSCINSLKTLTVRPASGVASPIIYTNSNTSGTFILDGASYVIIDGRNGGAGTNKFIRMINTSSTAGAAGNALLIRNDANNNLLTFLDLQASNLNPAGNSGTITAGTVPGVLSILSTTGLNGNDNNTVSFCDIHSATVSGNILNVGIYAFNGTTVGSLANNDNNTITDCNIYDIFNAGTTTAAIDILAGNNNYTISNNNIYKSSGITYTYTAAVTHRGFWITPGASAVASSGFNITGNFIGGTAPACGGTAYTMLGAVATVWLGMDVSVGTVSSTNVYNNTIQNIAFTTTSTGNPYFAAISVASGILNVGNTIGTGNTIGSGTGTGSITLTNSTTSSTASFAYGIRFGGGTVSVANYNTVGSITINNNAISNSFTGIATVGGGTTSATINNNLVGSLTTSNSIQFTGAGAAATGIGMCGIFISSGPATSTISNNVIANLNNAYTGTSTTTVLGVRGIDVLVGSNTITGNIIRNLTTACTATATGSGTPICALVMRSTTAPSTITGNQIYSLRLTTTSTTTGTQITGISYAGATSGINLISKNFIHSFDVAYTTTSSTAATFSGMDIGSGVLDVINNMIRLGINDAGNSITTPLVIRGFQVGTVSASNFYHNSVYIGGSGVLNASSVANHSTAFNRTATSGALILRNNIFANARTNAASGQANKHYSVRLGTATTGCDFNFNNYYYSAGNDNSFSLNNAATIAAYSAGWLAGDINSVTGDPAYLTPDGTSATVDLHINPAVATPVEGQGGTVLLVAADFDDQNRGTLTPIDIGADAGDFIGTSPSCSTVSLTAGSAVATSVTTCSASLSLTGNSTGVYGLNYQWQSRTPAGSGPFINIPGANLPTLNTNLPGVTSDFQCVVTCTGGSTATSALVSVVAASPGVAAGYSPLDVTGYNFDVIANGNTGTLNIPSASCTAPVDGTGSNYYFYDASYSYLGNVFPATSLPINGQVVSSSVTGLLYKLQPASGNNVLQLRGGTTLTGTLSLTTPQSGTAVYLLSNSGNGASTVNVTVTFTDASTQVFTGITIPDWFNVSPFSQGGFGRVRDASPGFDAGAPGNNNPRMYDVTLALSPANYSKPVESITVTNTTAGASATAFITNIFAVTMAVPEPTPFCGGLATSVTLFNPPSGATFQWQSSTTQGGPYTNVTGGTGATTTTYTNPSATGTIYYVCNVTCTSGGFSALSSEVVENINPVPVITVAPPSASICSGGTGVSITASGNSLLYGWSPATGLNTNSGPTVIANPTVTTVYTVTGVINGCLGTATATVNFINTPVAGASATFSNLCSGGSTTLNATPSTGGLTYSWSPSTFLNATTGSSVTASNVTVTTTYTVTVANGACTSTASVTITVAPLNATATASISSGTGCAGSTVYQLGTSITGGGQPYSYSWLPATGLNSTTVANPLASPAVTTTYTVTVTDACLVTSTSSVTINMVSSPSIAIVLSGNCSTGDTLTAVGTPPSGVNWYWQFTANGTSTALDATNYLVVTTNGTYYVRAFNQSSGCFANADSIIVNNFILPSAPPNPVAVSNPTCNPTTISVAAAPPGITYYWQSTASGTSLVSNASIPLPVAVTGTYYVRAFDNSGGCWSAGAGSVLVSIYQGLTGTVSATQITGCSNPTGLISANVSGAGTVINNDFSSPVLPPNMTSAGNSFAITGGQMQLTTNTGSQNGGVLITNPTGLANNDFQIDFDFNTTYNAAGNSDGLSYSYGDDVVALPSGTAAEGTTGVSTLAAECGSGTKLKLTFDAVNNTGGCTAGTPGSPSVINNGNTIGVYLMYNSTTQFQGPTCPGVIYYDGGPSNTTYTNYVAGGPGTAAGISWKPTSPAGASTHVTIKINALGQVSLWLNNIQVVFNQQLPPSYLTADKSTWKHAFAARTGANGEGHYIDNLLIQYNNFYEYSINGGGSWSTTNPIIPPTPGTYSVDARYVSVPTCFANIGSVTINTQVYNTTSTSTTFCTYGTMPTLGFSPAFSGASYQWESSPAGANTWTPIGGATSSTYTPLSGTLLINTDFRCKIDCGGVPVVGSPTIPVSVTVEAPVVSTVTNGTRCGSGSVNLSANVSAGATANWYTASTGGSSIGTGSPFATPIVSSTTTFYVSARTNSGCESPRTAVVANVTPSPVVVVSAGVTICEADSTTITAASTNDPNYKYTWIPGGFIGANYKVAPSVTTTYTVTALDTTGGLNFNCQDIKTVTITVNQRPAITSLSATPAALCIGDSAQITLNASPFIPPSGNYNVAPAVYSTESCPSNAGPTGDDAMSGTLPIGFNFNYFGTTYSQFAICTNGNIQLGNGSGSAGNPAYSTSFTPTALPAAGVPNNVIALCWADLTASAGNITYGTTGITPNQKLIVCFNNIPWLNGTGNLTGQIIISEGSTAIQLVLTSVTATTGNRVCGVENATGTLGTMAPGRTLGIWTTSNEKWIFTPPISSSLSYAWSPSTGLSATNVSNPKASPAGNTVYTVTISETGTGCVRTATLGIVVSATPAPVIYPNDTVLCTGSIINIVARDTGAYAGGWPVGTFFDYGFGPGTDSTFSVNGPGVYSVNVSLPGILGGCSNISSAASISYRDAPVLFVNTGNSNINCSGINTGYVSAQVFLGAPPYRFVYYNQSGSIVRNFVTSFTEDTLFNAGPGEYCVVVTDTINSVYPPPSCKSDSVCATVIAEPCITLQASNTPCTYLVSNILSTVTGGTPPFIYQWSNGKTSLFNFNVTAGTYTVTVTDANDYTSTASITVAPPGPLTVSGIPTNILCRGAATGSINLIVSGAVPSYTYLWNGGTTTQNRTGLVAGSYTVTVTDANGCTMKLTFSITQPATNLVINSSKTNVRCFGLSSGVATVTPSGGSTPYSYSWNTFPVQTTASISALAAGTYTCTITDAIGCTKTLSIDITEPTDIVVFQTQTNVTFPGGSNGTATVSVTGGTPGYTYSWNTVPVKTTTTVNGLTAGTYKCTITDTKSCQKKVTFIITEPVARSLDQKTGEWNVVAYPNPTSGIVLLSFTNENMEMIKVSLTDYTGRILYSKESLATVGINEIVYDFSGYVKGVYIIHISSGNKSKIIRMVIQ